MPRGRPPKPIEVKRRNGNPGKRKLPEQSKTVALQPADGLPPVPMDLAEHGRALWSHIWTGPSRQWLSPEVDIIRVTTVCHLIDEVQKHRSDIAKLGHLLSETLFTPTGEIMGESIKANPQVKMLRDAEKRLDEELSRLAFDPVSRSKLGLAEVKRQSILERLASDQDRRREESVEAEVIDIAADD